MFLAATCSPAKIVRASSLRVPANPIISQNGRSISHVIFPQLPSYSWSKCAATLIALGVLFFSKKNHGGIESYADSDSTVYNFSNAWQRSAKKSDKYSLQRFKSGNHYSYKNERFIANGCSGYAYLYKSKSPQNNSKVVKECTKNELAAEFMTMLRLQQINDDCFTGIELFPKAFIFDGKIGLKIMAKYDGTLNMLLGKQIAPKDAEKIIRQITEGISTLHHYKIAHNDLHEANIFFRVKNGVERYDICDFGHSSNYGDDAKSNKSIEEILTLHDFAKMSNQLSLRHADMHYKSDVRQYIFLIKIIMNHTGSEHFTPEFGNYMRKTGNLLILENANEYLSEIKILN